MKAAFRRGTIGRSGEDPPDEGFGVVASYADQERNTFEIAELTYAFEGGESE